MSSAAMNKIEVRNVFKIFGNQAQKALQQIRGGQSKDQVLAATQLSEADLAANNH